MGQQRKGETREEYRARCREEYAANIEVRRAQARAAYARKRATDPLTLSAQQRRYYLNAMQADPDGMRRYKRDAAVRYRSAHPERIRQAGQTWRDNGGNAVLRARTRRRREAVLQAYGGCCACCGEATYEFLCIDHIAGDGSAHRREMGVGPRGGSGPIYQWLTKQNYPAGFQVLCHNCNAAKGFYGGCPHEAERTESTA